MGTTRVVILFGSYAYKCARVRPLKTVLKCAVSCVSQKHKALLKEKYDKRILRAFWKYFWGGVYSNRAEYQYWRETNDSRCVPIIRMFLNGFIIVQLRADAVTLLELESCPISYLLAEKELTTAKQYGRIDGEYLVVDYAHWRMLAV
jgi:hypothetical protein